MQQALEEETLISRMLLSCLEEVVKTSIHEYQQAMNKKIQRYDICIEDLQTEVSKLQRQTEESKLQKQTEESMFQTKETEETNHEDSDSSSVWEINSASSDSEN